MPSPNDANGKICYVELPADDVTRSAEFYNRVFGWEIRRRGDGSTAFDDTTGQVSGAWIEGRAPSPEAGVLVYVMVDSAEETLAEALAAGATLAQPIGVDAPEITARILDPAGNVIGLYQQPAA